MKQSDVYIGMLYVAKVSNKLTVVRLEEIREVVRCGRLLKRYVVTNLKTDRRCEFRSAGRFKSVAPIDFIAMDKATSATSDTQKREVIA